MPRAADKRLARLRDRIEDGFERGGRAKLRLMAVIGAEIYEAVVAAGLNPDTFGAWRCGERAMQSLERLGDTPEQWGREPADAAADDEEWAARHPGEPHPRDRFFAELDRRALRYADGSVPDKQAPIIEWYAWARARLAPPGAA